MLRVRVDDQARMTTFYVEGKLTGVSVDELRKAWAAARIQNEKKPTVIELTSLFIVDAAGRKLLAEMHGSGAQLAGTGIMIRPLIDEIEGKNGGTHE